MGERHQDMAFGDKNNMYEITGHVAVIQTAVFQTAIINRVILVVVN